MACNRRCASTNILNAMAEPTKDAAVIAPTPEQARARRHPATRSVRGIGWGIYISGRFRNVTRPWSRAREIPAKASRSHL